MLIRGLVTTIPDDTPVPDGTTGEIRLLSDNSLVATVETTGGWYEYEQNGNPGPIRIFWDYANVVKNQYSKVVGPSGPIDVASIPLIFRTLNDGVIENVGNNLLVTANGSGMTVSVSIGAAMVKGVIYDQITAGTLNIDAANTQPRIDTVVVEVVPPGAGEDVEGRSRLRVLKGTPNANPVAPVLTQNSSLWQYPLANIAVGANVAVIASDKVTTRSAFVSAYVPTGSITTEKLANASVTQAKLAPEAGANTVVDNNSKFIDSEGKILDFRRPLIATLRPGGGAYINIQDGSITSAKLGNNSIGEQHISNGAVGSSELADGSVGTTKLADAAVTSVKLGNNSVGAAHIASGAVGTSEIADGAVTSVKLGPNSVGAAAIANGAVGTSEIADGSVTSAKLASGVGGSGGTDTPVRMQTGSIAASGSFSGGSRTLETFSLGPLKGGVPYRVLCNAGLNAKNTGNNGFFSTRVSINGLTASTMAHQTVGGVPKWCPGVSAQDVQLSTDGNVSIVISALFNSGDAVDLRDGYIWAIAVPEEVLT